MGFGVDSSLVTVHLCFGGFFTFIYLFGGDGDMQGVRGHLSGVSFLFFTFRIQELN